jgi:hypothetical protein
MDTSTPLCAFLFVVVNRSICFSESASSGDVYDFCVVSSLNPLVAGTFPTPPPLDFAVSR